MSDDDLRAWLGRIDERWQETGVPILARQRLRRMLERDLLDALASGADVAELIASEPGEFADQVVAAHGVVGTLPGERAESLLRTAVSVVAGAALGALAVWFVVWPLLFRYTNSLDDQTLLALAYPIGAFVVLLGGAAGLRWRLGAERTEPARVLTALAGLVGGALLGLPATLIISGANDYPTEPVLVVIEAVPVVALGLVGVLVAQWCWACWVAIREPASAHR